ncbi:hypothetical protein HMF8227_01345 [Saliniradius amylolyticus]|uniref:CPXCG motif-containing cysteine-rich protein n=1 Tax=Saliniradius amylolyticus TaxID=2183582 RepID=A0A2S2E2G5_9ALTE|nr:CPXCG motif-containing cysteine-rich protein [Saliniradius amylolyticus]AWL11823.1 hypothetical protein HMF8227_01345 [Saliniradius amylolyticus]
MHNQSQTIECPHCGHHLHIELDYSQGDQNYYEDCTNCCNPIHLQLHIDEEHKKLSVRIDGDDEQLY